MPTVGLVRPDIGKLEVGTSFVLVERGVSCGSWLLFFSVPSLSTESYNHLSAVGELSGHRMLPRALLLVSQDVGQTAFVTT
jgi:Ni/Fe-hydrogenase subunit HybB-like protein